MRIYLVHGSTGEYSDRNEWVICGYKSREAAEQHKARAQQRQADLEAQHDYWGDIPLDANQFDLAKDIQYTGKTYQVSEIELKG